MRKLDGIVKKKYDVVIIDHMASEWLQYCIPADCTSFVVKIRNIMPFVKSFSFLYSLFKSLFKSGLTSTTLLSAIILELKPKVVVTLIDNNRFMGELQTIFPDILVISIQGGVRFNDPNIKPRGEYFSFPNYFGFGGYELDMMQNAGAKVKEYYSKGSLRMGIFLSTYLKPVQISKNISFISSYVNNQDNTDELMYVKITSAYRKICELLLRFSQENNVGITIIMKHDSTNKEMHQNELNFFEEIFGHNGAIYCVNERLSMSSYQIGMESSLVVGLDSALLFELFGVEKKILCCGITDDSLAYIRGNKGQCAALPNEVLLDNWSYDEFKSKATSLLNMREADFIEKTKDAREYYMNFGDDYPHQIVYHMIQSKCEYQ